MKNTFQFLGATILAAALFGATGAVAQSQNTTSSGSSVSVSTVNGESVVTFNGKEIYKGPTSGAVSSRSSSVNGVEYSAVYDGDKLLWESSPGGAQQIGPAAATGGVGATQNQFTQQQQAMERMMEMQRRFMQAHGGGSFGSNFSAPLGGPILLGGSPSSSGSSSYSFGGGSSGGPGGKISGAQTGPATINLNAKAGISIKMVNGSTVVVYNGQEMSVGPTRGKITAKSKSLEDKDYAAMFDDDRVVWENVPGAAMHLK
jgi:hypothetical protein